MDIDLGAEDVYWPSSGCGPYAPAGEAAGLYLRLPRRAPVLVDGIELAVALSGDSRMLTAAITNVLRVNKLIQRSDVVSMSVAYAMQGWSQLEWILVSIMS